MHYVLLSSTGNMIDSYEEEQSPVLLFSASSTPSPTLSRTLLLSL